MTSTTSAAPAAGFSGQVLNMNTGNKQEVVLFRPGSFNDTSKAADDLRNRKAVIVNMENVDKAMARRVVDFLSGCVYALDGDVKKIAQSAYLFCPHNMDIVGDLETLQAEVESYHQKRKRKSPCFTNRSDFFVESTFGGYNMQQVDGFSNLEDYVTAKENVSL